MDNPSQIIEGIKTIRISKGLTQEDMASILGVNRATYMSIENNKRDLTVAELNKIRTSLNLSMYDIINPSLSSNKTNEQKFKQIYLYVLENYFKETGVPKTKLAKILYLIDFTNFYLNLEPMSNMKYVRRDYGPVADVFFSLTDEMYDDGIINIQPLDMAQMIEPSFGEKDFSLITDEDKKIIDRVCVFWQDKRTKEIVNFTHSQKPWQDCRDGEEIPYTLIIQENPDHVFAPVAL